jgi:hypothetical protein
MLVQRLQKRNRKITKFVIMKAKKNTMSYAAGGMLKALLKDPKQKAMAAKLLKMMYGGKMPKAQGGMAMPDEEELTTTKLSPVTVTDKMGGGVKRQSFGSGDFEEERSNLMNIEISKLMEGKPKGYQISEAERKMAQDRVREKLQKSGKLQRGTAFRDSGRRLTPAQEAEVARLANRSK